MLKRHLILSLSVDGSFGRKNSRLSNGKKWHSNLNMCK